MPKYETLRNSGDYSKLHWKATELQLNLNLYQPNSIHTGVRFSITRSVCNLCTISYKSHFIFPHTGNSMDSVLFAPMEKYYSIDKTKEQIIQILHTDDFSVHCFSYKIHHLTVICSS